MLAHVVLLAACSLAGSPEDVTVFRSVHVIPMDLERVLENQTVVIRDGVIDEIAPADELELPEGAQVIDGSGRYLMPGLTDMHVHANAEEDLFLFVAYGVTSVRNMWGMDRQLEWQQRVENEPDFVSPWIYTTGPIVDGVPPIWPGSVGLPTAAAAREEVQRQAEQGFRMVKVYNRLKPEVYDAIVDEALKHDMRVVGHVPNAVGLEAALESGQATIEHLTGYFDMVGGRRANMQDMISLTVDCETWNCPTHVVHHKIAHMNEADKLLAMPEMRYVSPSNKTAWDPSRDFRFQRMNDSAYQAMREGLKGRLAILRALHEAGARLLLGSDTPNPFVIQGYALHEELQFFVDAGLTPYDAIAAGTVDAAEFLHAEGEFGTVEVGARADLILVEANPLEDVTNVGRRAGVMVRGHWLPSEVLDAQLEERAKAFEEATGEEAPPDDDGR